MRKKASRRGDRHIDFLKCRVVFVFVFIFVEAGLLNCINCNPVPRGTTNHSDEASEKFASLQTDSGPSWIWRSRKAVSQRRCSPTDFFSPAEDALKRRVT